MKDSEFLDRLEATRKKRQWRVYDCNSIRTERGECPLEAVAGTGKGSLTKAIKKLGIGSGGGRTNLAVRVMDAADFARKYLAGSSRVEALAMRRAMIERLQLAQEGQHGNA